MNHAPFADKGYVRCCKLSCRGHVHLRKYSPLPQAEETPTPLEAGFKIDGVQHVVHCCAQYMTAVSVHLHCLQHLTAMSADLTLNRRELDLQAVTAGPGVTAVLVFTAMASWVHARPFNLCNWPSASILR